MKRVIFIHRGGPEMASYRYRCEMPAKYLNENGWDAQINSGKAEIVVFAKPSVLDVELAKECKGYGAKIVFDVTDPHFHREEYQEMSLLADYITCASEWTRDKIVRADAVIDDPYEFPLEEPHATSSMPYDVEFPTEWPNVLWFGHKANLDSLGPYKKHCTRIISGPYDEAPEGITFYSPENLLRALREANIFINPTVPGTEYKSPNRLVNALRMGVFPVVGSHPSHTQFRKFCWVGPNLKAGLQFAKQERKYLNDLVAEGQEYIERFSPERIGEQWKDLLDSI